MKYIIMFFCIIFCIIGDGALWLVGKMSELVQYGTEKVMSLERSEHRGAHERGRLPLVCGVESERRAEVVAPYEWPEGAFAPYDWAKESDCEA